MQMSWTFGKKLAAGFAFAALVTLVVAVFGFRSSRTMVENDGWVRHTYDVRAELASLMLQVKSAEGAARAFAILGEDDRLAPYDAAVAKIDPTIDHLKSLTQDNRLQRERLDALLPLLKERREQLTGLVSLRREGRSSETPELKESVRAGGDLMGRIEAAVTELDRHELELLEERRRSAEDSARTTEGVIVWGSVLGTVLIGVVGMFLARSLTNQLSSAVQRIQSSSTELQTAANQQVTGVKEQAAAMNEITTTMNELLATSRQIAESAQRVAQIAEQTAADARTGDSTVERGNDALLGIRRQVDLIVSHMLELGKKSQQIGAVLDIVSELAEQTNILAINATIEAAGAGDAGKRFAVVAEEIRKLADRVGGSTKEIRGLIDDVRSAVNKTVMTTETGSKAVEGGSSQFAEVATAFKRIARLVTTTMEAAREIELSTKQQSTAVEQVNVAITSAAQATRETEASSGQTLQTASELTGLSRELLRIVETQAANATRRSRAA